VVRSTFVPRPHWKIYYLLALLLVAPATGVAGPPGKRPRPRPSGQRAEPRPAEPRPADEAAPDEGPVDAGKEDAADDGKDGAEPAAASARPLLEQLARAATPDERKKAALALAALDPMPVAELSKFLGRTRTSAEPDRRRLLGERGFEVPDAKGKFTAPGRQTDKAEKANDKLDWLAALYPLPASPALADVIADIAVIRALAASKVTKGARAIIRFAFAPDGMAYRDECGRWLRRMSPWSLPALIGAAENPSARNASAARYARYQLERLDRENPRKALNDAPTDALQVEILRTFAESQYREAVFVVMDNVDHVSPKVRQAARKAWLEYATGRPPKPAPKQKLQLPGGKLSEEEVPLWLDHRELADIAIRRRLEELTGKKPAAKATLGELSKQLFAFYDRRRGERLDKELAAGLAEAQGGKIAEAARRFDAILVQAPDYGRRGEMAETYFRLGERLEKAGKMREAATAFGKANGVAPDGPMADEALARHHRARGKGLAAEGKKEVAAAEMQRATEIDRASVNRRGVTAEAGRGDRGWMLAIGIAGAAGGLLLLAMGLAWRRRAWRAWRG
jgi:tetratricopeptide (TPR) repeat protein